MITIFIRKEIQKKRLNKVFLFSVEVLSVFIFNCYLSVKSVQFVFLKKRESH